MSLRDTLFGAVKPLRDKLAELADNAVNGNTVTYTAEAKEPDPGDTSDNEHDDLMGAIAYNESRGVAGDKYAFNQPSGIKKYGQARGKYQVTDAELKDWSKLILGKSIKSDEFQKSPDLQEEYMKKKIEMLKRDVPDITNEEIMAIHNKGMTHYMKPEVRQKRLKQAEEYVKSGLQFLSGDSNADE